MKKLITLVEAVDKSLYSNIKWGGTASSDDINSSLLEDIDNAANSTNIMVTISTANSGHKSMTSSGKPSRHKKGQAVDISKINWTGWSSKEDAKSKNIISQIESFVTKLSNKGYKINSESGNSKSVLYFGFPGHGNHIHVSKTGDSSSDESSEETTDIDTDNFAVKFINDLLSKRLGLDESKQIRVLKNIQKIKNLL